MRLLLFFFFFFSLLFSFSQEICNNAIDDDGDGLIDLNDSLDCACAFQVTPPSLIPNHSFEDTVCCPSTGSQMTCADNWIQASMGTTDYFHSCDYLPFPGFDPQQPFPGNGDAIVGFYSSNGSQVVGNEYAGACLNGTMLAGVSYTLSFYTAYSFGSLISDLAIFGTPDCSDLPWNSSIDCPIGYGSWQLLSSQVVNQVSSGAWQQITMTFIPTVNINAVAIGSVCSDPSSMLDYGYYFIDELTVNKTNLYSSILDQGLYCEGDLVLTLNANNSSNFQWYQNNIALPAEADTFLNAFNYPPGDYTVTYTQDGICKFINYTVEPSVFPIANVIRFKDSLCAGENAILIGDSSITPAPYANWYYDFQDGSPTTNSYFIDKEYQMPGSYPVKFVVETDMGCKDSIEVPISVFSLPIAQLELTTSGTTYQPVEGDTIVVCENDSIYMNNLSSVIGSSTISNYEWDFGDMNTSNLENPIHKYANIGFYSVKHIIKTNRGCNDTLTFTIEIKTSPEANFTINGSNCENELLSFTNLSSIALGSIINYQWDFGDLIQSANFEPQHQYASQGNYDIKLIIESVEGCMDSIIQSITINPAPVTDFLISGFCQGDTIGFTDQSTVSTGTIVNWQWHFGDGNSSILQDTSHYYTLPNTYSIELIVETNQGCVDTLDSLYIIAPSPQASFIIDDYCENETIQVTNTSSISSGTINYLWNFQNNITSTSSNPPSFTYATSGQYAASLTLTSDQGCIASSTQIIIVQPTPLAIINEDPIGGCSPLRVNFSNVQDPNISSCIWNLGDGTVLEECGSVDHIFEPGTYDVELTVYSQYNCTNSSLKSDFIEVIQTPIAAFNHSPQSLSVSDNAVNFVNNSIGATNFIWDFGADLGSSTDENPTLVLANIAKTYRFRLTAISSNGLCKDETIKIIKVADELLFYVPNSFTPDDNGFNETFMPVMTSGFDIYSYQLTIFNRWGEILFISKDPQQGWDGTYNSESIISGVYIWQIDYYLIETDQGMTQRGTVNLIR